METQGYRFEYRRSEVRGQWVFFWRAAEHSELWCDIFGPDVLVLVVCSSVFAFSLTSLWRPLSLLHQTYLQNGLKNYLKKCLYLVSDVRNWSPGYDDGSVGHISAELRSVAHRWS